MNEDEEVNNEVSEGGADPSGLSEADSIEAIVKENEQLRAAIRLGSAERTLTDELVKAGARSPRLMFEVVKGDLRFDDNGQLLGTDGVIDGLKQKFPEQFGKVGSQPSIDAGAGMTNRQRLTRTALARMKPAEIAALDWADVRRVLAG